MESNKEVFKISFSFTTTEKLNKSCLKDDFFFSRTNSSSSSDEVGLFAWLALSSYVVC